MTANQIKRRRCLPICWRVCVDVPCVCAFKFDRFGRKIMPIAHFNWSKQNNLLNDVERERAFRSRAFRFGLFFYASNENVHFWTISSVMLTQWMRRWQNNCSTFLSLLSTIQFRWVQTAPCTEQKQLKCLWIFHGHVVPWTCRCKHSLHASIQLCQLSFVLLSPKRHRNANKNRKKEENWNRREWTK